MDKIDVFIPASVSTKTDDTREVDDVRKNYSELNQVAGVTNKAFIEFHGKPMWKYIMETLDECDHVGSITVLGQTEETFPFKSEKPIYYIEGGASTFDTTMKALDFYNSWEEPPKLVMNIPTDSPLIQPAMISKMVEAVDLSEDKEFYWNIIIAEDVYHHYPEITKVPFKLREVNLRFGDLHILSPKVIEGREDTLALIMGNRKNVFGIVKLFGIPNLIKYVFHRIGIREIKERIEGQFDLKAKIMITEFPEPCIDLDYAKDLENFERWLGQEHRPVGEDEKVVMIENQEEMDAYLESRNYIKGEYQANKQKK